MSLHIYFICWCSSLCATCLTASRYTENTMNTKVKACSLQVSPWNTQYCCLSEVSTSSRKTKKVTFLPSVATSVPSLVKSWRPLGAWLGHFCRLGLYFNRVPSVQLLDKALRYLEFIKDPKKTQMSWHKKCTHMKTFIRDIQHPTALSAQLALYQHLPSVTNGCIWINLILFNTIDYIKMNIVTIYFYYKKHSYPDMIDVCYFDFSTCFLTSFQALSSAAYGLQVGVL